MRIYEILYLLIIGISKANCSELFAILMDTSRYWYNYRQNTDILLIYQNLRRFGVPDKNIILMIPENQACNSRNSNPGTQSCKQSNLMIDAFIDLRHSDIYVTKYLDIIRGRYPKNTPQSKKINLDSDSRLLIYQSGHGGDGYLKMQDTQVISSYDFGKSIKELHDKHLYKDLLMFSDSCESLTHFNGVQGIQNAFAIGSSLQYQRSISDIYDDELQLAKVDKFSKVTSDYLQYAFSMNTHHKLSDLLKSYTKETLGVDHGFYNYYKNQNESSLLVKNYFHMQYKPQWKFSNKEKNTFQFQENKLIEKLMTSIKNEIEILS